VSALSRVYDYESQNMSCKSFRKIVMVFVSLEKFSAIGPQLAERITTTSRWLAYFKDAFAILHFTTLV